MHRLFTVHSEQLVGTHNGKNLCKYTQTIKSALVVKFTVLKKEEKMAKFEKSMFDISCLQRVRCNKVIPVLLTKLLF